MNLNYKNIKRFLAPALAFTIVTTLVGCNNNEVKIDEELKEIGNAKSFSMSDTSYQSKHDYIERIKNTLEDIIPSKVKYIDDYDITGIA